MKKILNLFIFVTIFSVAANAQSDYKSGIGLRFGGYYDLVSASYKTFISEQGAIELNLGFRNYSLRVVVFTFSFSTSREKSVPLA